MSRHTPGPWHVEPVDHAVDGGCSELPLFIAAKSPEAFAQWGLMGDYRGTRVAYIAESPHVRQSLSLMDEERAAVLERINANARLISAAPDLLAALELVLPLLRGINERCTGNTAMLAAVTRAIVKATGDQP